MAGMQRGTKTYERTENPAFGVTSYKEDPEMKDFLNRHSATDPRLSNEQRLDQRYQNYQYGPTPEYATQTAAAQRQTGIGAQGIFAGLGQEAWGTGQGIQTRTTPTTDYSTAQQVYGNQVGLTNRLTDYAMQGPGPSRAQADLQANTAAGMRQQLALAGSGRGAGGGAAAFRNAQNNQAIMQGQANAQAGVLEAAEDDAWRGRQLQAFGQQGTMYGQMAQQQAGQAQFVTQAELDAQAQRDQAGLAYQELGGQLQGQGFQTQLGFEEAAHQTLQSEADANQAYEENLTNIATGKMAANANKEEGPGTLDTALGVASAAGGLAMMFSDKRGKTNMRQDDDLNDRYATLNDTDFTNAGWTQQGSTYRSAAERQDAAALEKQKRDQKEREAKEKAERAKRAGGFQTFIGGVRSALSDERSKERIREIEDLSDRYAALVDEDRGSRLDAGIRDPYADDRYNALLDDDETAAAHAPASSTTYEYKNPEAPGAGRGRYAGPMAQELEGLPGVVKNTPRGKMVDPARLTMANTSAIGSLERRQRALEAANNRNRVDYVFDANEEGGEGRKVQYRFGPETDVDYAYDALNDAPAPAPRPPVARPVNTSAAPSQPVQQALGAFGSYVPTDGDIATQREAVRAKHGSRAAGEFERYAMALKRERGRRPVRVDFGPAQIGG